MRSTSILIFPPKKINLANLLNVPFLFHVLQSLVSTEHAVIVRWTAFHDRNETVTMYVVLCAFRSVLFDLPSQWMLWVGQVLLMHFANKETKLEHDSADSP